MKNDFIEAEADFNKAVLIEPESGQINNTIWLFYLDLEDTHSEFVDYPRALLYEKKAATLSELHVVQNSLAMAYYFNNEFDETISILKVRNFINEPEWALWLGLAYLGKEDEMNARYYLGMALDNGADVPQEVKDYLNQ
mgnify:CR=1 FL=1